MSELNKEKLKFIDDSVLLEKFLKNPLKSPLDIWRTEGLDRFQLLGMPTSKDEEWRYTNLKDLVAQKFVLPQLIELKSPQKTLLQDYSSLEDLNLVFVNGFLLKEYSSLENLPKGIEIVRLQELSKDNAKDVHDIVRYFEKAEDESLVALNKAFSCDGVFIKVATKTVVKKLIHIIHLTIGSSSPVLSVPRTLILMDPSSQAQILESHIDVDSSKYFTAPLTDILLKENAHLIYSKAQAESKEAFHLGTTRVWQEQHSQLNSFTFSCGANLARHNLNITLNGSGADAMLNGFYVVDGSQHVDNHTTVSHIPPHCTSNQLYKGILYGSGRAVFNGKIFVHREAQQTNAYQLNKNLLLGPKCRVDTKPQLEIFADDVKCTHGATIGQLNEDELFYLQSRAILKEKAVQMLARGFVDDVFNRLPSKETIAKFNKLLGPILH